MLKKISVWYALVLFLCFIVYPWWLLLDSFPKGLILVNALLLLILGGYYVLKKILKDAEVVIPLPSRRQFLLMLLFFFLLLGIHAYALSFPIQPSDDEHFHASKGVYLAESVRLVFTYVVQNYLFLFITSLLLLFGIGYLLIKNKDCIHDRWKKSKVCTKIVFISSGIFIANIYFIVVRILFEKVGLSVFGSSISSSLGWLIRFPPLGTIINGVVSSPGIQEIVLIRVVQVIFIFLTAYYLYKLISLQLDKEIAMFSSILFLFIPGVFYFSNLAFMTGGELFFLVITSYYFIKYMQVYIIQDKHSLQDLGLLVLFILIGFFYKEPMLFILPVFMASLVLEYANKNHWQWQKITLIFKKFRLFWLLTIITGVFAGVWIIIRYAFFALTNSQQQYLVFSNLVSLDRWINYLRLFPEMLTRPITILLLLSILYFFIVKYKDLFINRSLLLVRFSLLWIIIIIAIYTMYNWQEAVLRFLATIIPSIIILISFFINSVNKSLFFRRIIFGIFIIFLVFQSIGVTYQDIDKHYWPYDELYSYLHQNLSPEDTVLFLVQHMDFYLINENVNIHIIPPQEIPNNTLNSTKGFLGFLEEKNITHIVLADSNNIVYTTNSFAKPDIIAEKFYKPASLFFENISNTTHGFTIEKEFGKEKNRLLLVKIINES